MPTLVDAVDAVINRSQAAAANATPEDLVYLAKTLEAVGPASTAQFVSAVGDAQVARVAAAGETQTAVVQQAGTDHAAAVSAAGTAEVQRVQTVYATDTGRLNDMRSTLRIAKLPRGNDWGGHIWTFPVILEGGKQIGIMGRNGGGQSALLSGYDDIDFSRGHLSTVAVSPTLDPDDEFIEVNAGSWNTYAVTKKGFVYAGGYNNYGQLGHGDTNNTRFMKRIEAFVTANRKIASIRVAYDNYWQYGSAYFITTTGEVWGVGYNGYGNLGDGTSTNRALPVRCGLLSGVIDLSVSGSLSSVYAWNEAGQCWAWGKGSEGQLGLGTTTDRWTPIDSLTNVAKVLSSQGGYWNGTNHASISAYAMALLKDGTIRTAGINPWGQLGVGDTNQRNSWTPVPGLTGVSAIAIAGAGYQTSFAIKEGVAYAWGSNWDGACSTGDASNRTAPVECVLPPGLQGKVSRILGTGSSRYNTVFFLTNDGRLLAAGANNWGNHGTPVRGFATTNYANLVDLPAGMAISDLFCADVNFAESGLATWILSSQGELYAAGYNGHGLLGDLTYRGTNGYFRPVMF
jgi:alpha-tubulin suppressor-like RCC1 family protein